MKITKLKLTKSKTIGMLDQHGRTKFNKIQFTAESELTQEDDPIESYKSLSTYIDDMLLIESKKK